MRPPRHRLHVLRSLPTFTRTRDATWQTRFARPAEKIDKFKCFYEKFQNNDFEFNNFYIPYEFDKPSYQSFLEIIKQGFREPRKKLLKNLLNSGYDKGKILVIFEKLSISDTVRGEELGIEEWIEVVKELEIDER